MNLNPLIAFGVLGFVTIVFLRHAKETFHKNIQERLESKKDENDEEKGRTKEIELMEPLLNPNKNVESTE